MIINSLLRRRRLPIGPSLTYSLAAQQAPSGLVQLFLGNLPIGRILWLQSPAAVRAGQRHYVQLLVILVLLLGLNTELFRSYRNKGRVVLGEGQYPRPERPNGRNASLGSRLGKSRRILCMELLETARR